MDWAVYEPHLSMQARQGLGVRPRKPLASLRNKVLRHYVVINDSIPDRPGRQCLLWVIAIAPMETGNPAARAINRAVPDVANGSWRRQEGGLH